MLPSRHPMLDAACLKAERLASGKDNCEVCFGEQGGALGNENWHGPLIVCDYCDLQLSSR